MDDFIICGTGRETWEFPKASACPTVRPGSLSPSGLILHPRAEPEERLASEGLSLQGLQGGRCAREGTGLGAAAASTKAGTTVQGNYRRNPRGASKPGPLAKKTPVEGRGRRMEKRRTNQRVLPREC